MHILAPHAKFSPVSDFIVSNHTGLVKSDVTNIGGVNESIVLVGVVTQFMGVVTHG
jgi:hypothetical protein